MCIRDSFTAQMQVYETYHAGDATAFWTGSDAWERPLQIAGPIERAGEIHFPDPERSIDPDERIESGVTTESFRMKPAYLMARLPGDSSERFVIETSFTPRDRQNVVGYVAGWVDSQGRLRLTALSLPRDRLTLGPAQATRRILASAEVSKRLELLNRETRDLGKAAVQRTVLGIPRVLPLADQLVTVQPVYTSAGGDGVQRVELVAVHANGRVGYGDDVETAFKQVLASEVRRREDVAAPARR